ncbi:CutA1 divalent ion tolerance protein [Thermovibrio ammonificans HB-1]|uniref:CutA1 divalent ion tolerance protein n=1 Tax=Thermovibrio ammonificans (strain DSM 15698 / JCM 12110 / HB-1) TaxID=648996 RepID=E8T366_THEA1|nr:divalent-cation tolerance protein CutA [Thermovibrio ammonificans]ADU96071.1 CutA1 divalent ion tolerance protein [Thermovibrio ammonificans HB-1]
MENFIQVITTTPTKGEAEKIGKVLLEGLLAACIQILGPVESCYWWEGRLEKSKEWFLIVKTQKRLYPRVEQIIKRLHSYKVPEIIAIPIVAGYKPYLNWVHSELR